MYIVGFGKRRNRGRRDDGTGRSRPKLAIIGAISLAIGILLIHYYGIPLFISNRSADNPFLMGGVIGILGGVLMLLFSLSKRNQIRLAKGIEETRKTFADNCQCCKCQNCGRNHNHWVHDDDDRRRHY